jgi:hypothetical protein
MEFNARNQITLWGPRGEVLLIAWLYSPWILGAFWSVLKHVVTINGWHNCC